MKDFINIIAPLTPAAIQILEIIAFIVCRKEIIQFIRDLLSDDGKLSSRRGIAFGAALTLFDLCINYHKDIDVHILWMLVTLIVLCLGLATFPEIIELWGKATAAIGKMAGSQAPAPAQLSVNTEILQVAAS